MQKVVRMGIRMKLALEGRNQVLRQSQEVCFAWVISVLLRQFTTANHQTLKIYIKWAPIESLRLIKLIYDPQKNVYRTLKIYYTQNFKAEWSHELTVNVGVFVA